MLRSVLARQGLHLELQQLLPALPEFAPNLTFCAVYATANVSGGHLNPAVTLATMVSIYQLCITVAAAVDAAAAVVTAFIDIDPVCR